MIIMEEPYISDVLQLTAKNLNIPVLKNDAVKKLGISTSLNYLADAEAISGIKNNPNIRVYSNSENSINWISENLSFTSLPSQIEVFKDKAKFRNLISKMYPNFFFKEIEMSELEHFCLEGIKFPFVIKPTVGFLSLGVYVVNSMEEWGNIVKGIKADTKKFDGLFPIEVMNSSNFIIEEFIEGKEFAVDVYFDENSKPVILNIFEHPFVGLDDVSDRVYISSKEIILNNIGKFQPILEKIGELTALKNFPMHIELRVSENGVVPIEVNPMRFAGWCTTDLGYYAYGINLYEYYFENKKPDWPEILKDKEGILYYFAMADIPKSIDNKSILSFDYASFMRNFSNPLEVRKIDYKNNPLFAIVFAQTNDYTEVETILKLDITKYIKGEI